MGLLDDAIREHLDLKRRRGADPAEIERAEREALGPVRRNREPGAGDEFDPVAVELDPAVGSARDEPDGGAASDLVDEDYGEEEPATGENFLEDDGEFEDEDLFEEDELRAEEPLAEDGEPDEGEDDPHRTQLMQAVDIPAAPDATAEHDVEQAFAEDEGRRSAPRADEEDEDVLEETPEFLQDTPDHDRLWFEQRPPRDFDFDG